MAERRTVRVSVFDGEQYDGSWPSPEYESKLVDVIAWFETILETIPEEYRDVARCRIDSASGYEGSHYGHIEIEYYRPETDAEMARRIAAEKAAAAEREAQDLATLRALKAKYPQQS